MQAGSSSDTGPSQQPLNQPWPLLDIEGRWKRTDELHDGRPGLRQIFSGGRAERPAGVDAQRIVVFARRRGHGSQPARRQAGADNDRSGAISKQGCGLLVVPVEKPAHSIRADHQNPVFLRLGQNDLCSQVQRDHPSGAGAVHVKHSGSPGFQFGLHHGRRGRAEIIRGVGSDDDPIQRRRFQTRPGQRYSPSGGSQIRGCLIRRHEPPFADADMVHQPVVHGGAEPGGKFGIGHDPIRDVTAGTDNLGMAHQVFSRKNRGTIGSSGGGVRSVRRNP